MQVHVPAHVRPAGDTGAMTVDELFARFPEVPRDLRDEPVLARYVDAFMTNLDWEIIDARYRAAIA